MLVDKGVLGDVAREGLADAHGRRIDVQAGLDEGHGGILEVELRPGGERVVDAILAERLSRKMQMLAQPTRTDERDADERTSSVDSGWKLSTTKLGVISRIWSVVCLRLFANGAADAEVAHTTARRTDRKKALENFMAMRRVVAVGVSVRAGQWFAGEQSPGLAKCTTAPFVLASLCGPDAISMP